MDLGKMARRAGLAQSTMDLVRLRVSQLNGCGAALDRLEVSDERRFAVAGWRHSPVFTAAERAALALAEAATRLADTADPVPDEIWAAAAEHFTDLELAALILAIGITDQYHRHNLTE